MEPALRADALVPLDLLGVEGLAAAVALEEEPLAQGGRLPHVAQRAGRLVLPEPEGHEARDLNLSRRPRPPGGVPRVTRGAAVGERRDAGRDAEELRRATSP